MIKGVILKKLVTHCDERGFFRELIRKNDGFFKEGFGQWSHSLMYPGVIKAWHIHKRQTDWLYVASGVIKAVLYDNRSSSATFKRITEVFMGDGQPAGVLRVPIGVAHGCKCICGPANLFYITSKVYDPRDEGRIAFDDARIGYDWLSGPEIK
ncbi:MAG: dTDP-4-dehydrorhamnose 3,5-epimerase family protein [Candidatus Omnitrophota bacterium]